MKRIQIIVALLAITATPVQAQDLFSYLKDHASFVGGIVVVDDQKEKLVELRIVDDFSIGKFRGVARVGLFSVTRAGEQAPNPTLPTSIEEVKAYSDGEAWLSIYRPFNENLAAECLSGVMFKMISVTGQVGDPLDGTKFAFACGPRLSKNGHDISILAGHFGPVVEEDKLAGLLPSILIHAYLPLRFIGENSALVPDLAFGRLADGTITRTMRLGIATRF